MRVAVLATGGKDSALSLYHVLEMGHEVSCLVSMIPLSEDSWMFHFPNIHLVDLFAEAVRLPLIKAETQGVKEEEVSDLKRLLENLDIDAVVSGAIASNYQKDRVDRICQELGLKSIAPLWQKDQLEILKELLRLRFKVIVTGVYAYGFDSRWLGREIDELGLKDLIRLNKEYGISLVGEGGEYETFVLDAPFFRSTIRVVEAEKIWKGQSGYYHVINAKLEPK